MKNKKTILISGLFFLSILMILLIPNLSRKGENNQIDNKVTPIENKIDGICKDNFDCPDGEKCEENVCVDVGCVSEGKSIPGAISPDYRNHMATKCCEGLKHIRYGGDFDENCERTFLAGGPGGICSYCGNNNCENWETRCTCPEDCK